MESINGQSQAERAYQLLRSEILHGDLMPGERLRAADLQDRFELGLTPIREALMRLSSESLVEIDTHRGSRVSDVSLAEFTDLMATRRSIEALCIRSAIDHGDAAWEAEILASLHLLKRSPLPSSTTDRQTATEWEARHRRFHFALVTACREKWLLRFWNTLTDHSERYRKIRLLHQAAHHGPRKGSRKVDDEHQAITDAVLARQANRAVALMQAHLEATEQSVARLLQPQDPQGVSR